MPKRAASEPQVARRKYSLVDLFCGAGGLTQGFLSAKPRGFSTNFALDCVPEHTATYTANFGPHAECADISDFAKQSKNKSIKADIVIGGPPCQGFSNLGTNDRDDPRRKLWRYFMNVVDSSNCKVFLLENVPNILSSSEGDAIKKHAEALGFYIDASVLLASDFGVPQNRRRAFILGSRRGPIYLPTGSGEKTSVREAFRGIPKKPNVTNFKSNGPIPTCKLHIARNPTALSLKRYALIPPGGNRFDLQRVAPELTPDCWIRKTKGGTDLFGRIEWDGPARCTIRTEFYKPEKGRFLHPQENRPITHWEAARLQTFPDDFLWCGSKIQIAMQIGNAVPPLLAKAIAESIYEHLQTPKAKLSIVHK